MKKILCLFLIIPYSLIAQNKGIVFVQNLSWNQIQKKAKKENKYIFVDCFTTWCGPCRQMEKEVYSSDSVGKIINSSFISLKMQMDSTKKDNERVRIQYATAHLFEKKYKILVYPSYLFFSPDGNIVHKDVGALDINSFLGVAATALDPQRQYYTLLRHYLDGKKEYSVVPYLADMTIKLGEDSLGFIIAGDYVHNYLNRLPEHELYRKDNLLFISSHIKVLSSTDRVFQIYRNDSLRIDSILGRKGASKAIIDFIVYKEEITPILNAAKIGGPEPDWEDMAKTIAQKYNQSFVEQNILRARVEYFHSTKKWEKYIKYFVQKNQIDIQNVQPSGWNVLILNNNAFEVFQYSNNKEELGMALAWVDKALSFDSIPNAKSFNVIDTKANILYKLGRKEEGIILEEQAATMAPEAIDVRANLDKMKKGLPTWTSN